jgi:hypothetical protein
MARPRATDGDRSPPLCPALHVWSLRYVNRDGAATAPDARGAMSARCRGSASDGEIAGILARGRAYSQIHCEPRTLHGMLRVMAQHAVNVAALSREGQLQLLG